MLYPTLLEHISPSDVEAVRSHLQDAGLDGELMRFMCDWPPLKKRLREAEQVETARRLEKLEELQEVLAMLPTTSPEYKKRAEALEQIRADIPNQVMKDVVVEFLSRHGLKLTLA